MGFEKLISESSQTKLAAATDRVAAMDKIDGVQQVDYGVGVAVGTVLSALATSTNEALDADRREEVFWDAVVMLLQIQERHGVRQ